MKSIADALVYAVTYINLREESDDDEDVDALESIAGFLANAKDDELDELAAAAKRALAYEVSGSNRREFVDDLSEWMEAMIGDEWNGNERAMD